MTKNGSNFVEGRVEHVLRNECQLSYLPPCACARRLSVCWPTPGSPAHLHH